MSRKLVPKVKKINLNKKRQTQVSINSCYLKLRFLNSNFKKYPETPDFGLYQDFHLLEFAIQLHWQLKKSMDLMLYSFLMKNMPGPFPSFSIYEACKKLQHESFKFYKNYQGDKNKINIIEEDNLLKRFDVEFNYSIKLNGDEKFVELIIENDSSQQNILTFRLSELWPIYAYLDAVINNNKLLQNNLCKKFSFLNKIQPKLEPQFSNLNYKKDNYLSFLKNKTNLALTSMGHATVFVEYEGNRFLIDPIIHKPDPKMNLTPLPARSFLPLNAVFITHAHEDHLDYSAFLGLPLDIPIYIPRPKNKKLSPKTKHFFSYLGFKNIFEVSPFEEIKKFAKIKITAIPFYGEANHFLEFAATCFLFQTQNNKKVLFLADSSPDYKGQSLLSNNKFKQLIKKIGTMDVVLGTWWQQKNFNFDLSYLAPLLPKISPQSWAKTSEFCNCNKEYLLNTLKLLRPKIFLTYAENSDQLFFPKEYRSHNIENISFDWEGLDNIFLAIRQKLEIKPMEFIPYMNLNIGASKKITVSVPNSNH